MNYPRKNLIYLKQVYTFQSIQIKFKNPKSSLPLKRFIVCFLTTLIRGNQKSDKRALSYLAISYFYNYKPSPRILRQHCIFWGNGVGGKGNGVVILNRKRYNNAIEEIISDTSRFENLNEDPTLKREASLQRFLRKLKQKYFFDEIDYDKLYPSGSAPALIMVLLKCTNSSLGIHFLNFVR